MKYQKYLIPIVTIPNMSEVPSAENKISHGGNSKLRKLRILAPDGRDLGEFNLELRADDLLKNYKIIISKSHNYKTKKNLKRQVTSFLSSNAKSKMFAQTLEQNIRMKPRILLRKPKYNSVKCETFCDNVSKASKIKTLQQQAQQQQHGTLMHQNALNVEASQQVFHNNNCNNINKVLVSTSDPSHKRNLKHQTASVYSVINNVKSNLKIQEIRTMDNINFSDTNVQSFSNSNCKSIFSENFKDCVNKHKCKSDYLKMLATCSKGKCIATIKNTKHGKIVTSLSAINFMQNKNSKNCNAIHLDTNRKNNFNYQETSNNNISLQDKLDLASKSDQDEMKLQKTVVSDSEICSFEPNVASTQEFNLTVLSTSKKKNTANHNKSTCNIICDNTQNKYVKMCKSDNTRLQCDALCNRIAVHCTPDLEKTVDVDANVKLNVPKNKDYPKDKSQIDLSDRLNAIKKAIDSVKDTKIRKLALQALEDYRIEIEKYVPVQLSQKFKSVRDTQVQTEVFSLLNPNCFVSINEDAEDVNRINHITLHDVPNDHKLSSNIYSCDNSAFKNLDMTKEESDFDIDNFIDQICEEHSSLKIKDTLVTNTRYKRIVEQLESDFEKTKQHDRKGRLNIHNAVLSNNIYLVQRQLIVLKLFKKNIDVLTKNGETSLELAIKYDVNGEIVNLLLEAGAQPILPRHTHESALIIASKQSSPLLSILISRVLNSKLLNQVDSEGFAALHYCSMYNNLQGVKALLSAGVHVDLRDLKSGRTALFHAMDNSHIAIAQALLQAGANPNISNYSEQTPLLQIKVTNSYETLFGQKECYRPT